MSETITPITTPSTWAQLHAPVQQLLEALDPIMNWGVLGRADHRVTRVPEAVFDLHQNLAQLPQLLPGKATLKADSPRCGAFTIERNGRAPWLLWIRAHEARNHSEFGYRGVALQVGHRPEDLFIAEDIDAALGLVRNILRDPGVELRGGVFPAGTTH